MNYNNSRRNIILPLLLGVTLALGVIIGKFFPGGTQAPPSSGTGLRFRNDKLTNILNIIESNYVDSVNRNDLIETAIPAMLKKLDPHSVYIPAKDLARANEPLQGNFDGIGISFNMTTDTILVISTIPGGPSEKAGLLAGDKILFVNDSLVAGKNISDQKIMSMLKGPRGTLVKVKVQRSGQKDLIPFDITRDKIPMYSIDASYMVNDHTGYMKINNFAMTTFDEFLKNLRDLKIQGMESLILDLRGNSGGIMEASVQIANQFLKENQLIVYTKGRTHPRNEARATGKGEFETGDLVILMDEWSASASEILAGAIQDNDRGTIIGRRSFGKGLVQEPVSFADGSGMRLTIARYYTPTGRSIQRSYSNGFDEYYEELLARSASGDTEASDSIHTSDSLKFTTPGGKVVYGGGGIMPDEFVPVDTSGISEYFLSVRPLIYRFALKYTESNREKLNKITEPAEMKNYLDRQQLLNQFIRYASANGIKEDRKGLKTSGTIINIQLEAYIARNILDNKGFYPIWENIDTTLKFAINYLEKNKSVNREIKGPITKN
ncbi:MAG TPA: S41 family peptidase [Bacteroidales bacterium]|nr:S41 family peptidase [Bacteroidales bacterium]